MEDLIKHYADLKGVELTPEELSFKLEEVEQYVKNYTNRQDIPKDLRFVIARMVVDYIATAQNGGTPQTIKVGDTSVSFKSTGNESLDGIIYGYREQLNKFRKVRWNREL